MHISLPVHYAISTRLKHHRSHQTTRVYQHADFVLEEISAADAPIVIQGFDRNNTPVSRYEPSPYGRGHREVTDYRDEPNPTGILRYHDNSLWYPEFNAGNVIATPGDWSSIRAKGTPEYEIEHRFWDATMARAKERGFASDTTWSSELDPDEHRDIRESDFEETRAFYAEQLANDIRVIDGQIYRRSPEPFYAINRTHDHVKAVLQFSPNTKIKTGEKIEFFRLDRYDDMVAHLNEAKDLFPEFVGNRKIIAGSRPEVHIEGILEFRDDETSMRRTARIGCEEIEDKLKTFQRETGMLWYDLRDAIAAAKEHPDSENTELVADAYSKLCADLSQRPELESDYRIRGFIEDANFALNRWEMRAIDLNISFQP